MHLRPDTAHELKMLATSAKRTATEIRHIVARHDIEAKGKPLPPAVNLELATEDRRILLAAVDVLTRIGAGRTLAGRIVQDQEKNRAAALLALQAAARAAFEAWPSLASILDKVAFIIACGHSMPLHRSLQDGPVRPYTDPRSEAEAWQDALDRIQADAAEDLIRKTASRALAGEYSIRELMDEARTLLSQIREREDVLRIAVQFSSRIPV